MTQFTVPVTWRVTSCDATVPDSIKIKVSADITSATVNDPEHFYMVDPRSLSGPFRNTEFSMEWYENRGLKSINSSVDDQTGPILINVATGLAKLAAVGLGQAAGSAPSTCPKAVLEALAVVNGDEKTPGSKASVEATEKLLAARTEEVTRLTTRATSMGNDVDGRTRDELGTAVRALEALSRQLRLDREKLDEQLEVITAKYTEPLTELGLKGPITLPKKQADAWNVTSSTAKNADVHLRLYSLEEQKATGGEELKTDDPEAELPKTGLPYREPRLSRVEVCLKKACDQKDKVVIKELDGPVLQTGTLFYLPFEARTFASVKNGATFSESGVLITATSNQPRAAGVGASDTFKGLSEQTAAFVTGQRGAETALINAKVAQAKAQKELNDAVAALGLPAPATSEAAAIAAFETEAAVAKAETTAIEAIIARDAARALLPR
jgi:hypothetical protein